MLCVDSPAQHYLCAGVACAAAAAAAVCAEFIALGEEELVGEDGALAAALAARRGGEGAALRGWRPAADPLDLCDPDDADTLDSAELALMEAALRRGTRRRQGDNFTREADERSVLYKCVQLMFHAYYASRSRLEALSMVVRHIEHEELFLMAYAFKKMETWLAAAKTMYYQVVTEHNREVARPYQSWHAAYEKYGPLFDDPKWRLTWFNWMVRPFGWDEKRIPLYQSAMPHLKYPHLLPYKTKNLTEAHIHHQELLAWRNYTLAVHLMVDLSYTCEFVQYLNERLRKLFKLDEDDTPIN